MCRKLTSIITLFAFLFGSLSLAQAPSSLKEIPVQIQGLISQLQVPGLSNAQKIQLVLNQKKSSELALKDLISAGAVDPSDLQYQDSDLYQTFKFLDRLTVLAQLEIDLKTERVSLESCNKAVTMLRLNLTETDPEQDRGTLKMTQSDQQVSQILNLMCQK